MKNDSEAFYSALVSRDPRFDGVFYVAVTSTGIYCRPVCTARTPRATNCRFFGSRELAEKSGFRPCLRCRPELAPGNAPVDDGGRIAGLIAQRIDEGMLDDGAGLERIATQFGWSSRQIRRILRRQLGVSPIELALTRRLLLAKQLLTETRLPITEVAVASGFSSLRRFNDAFSRRYSMPPTRFRKGVGDSASPSAGGTFTLQLGYRAPFDWEGLLSLIGARAMAGVEAVTGSEYLRTVELGPHRGWIRVGDLAERRTLQVELTHSLTPALPVLLGRLRNLFDLSARPDVIAAHLASDPVLSRSVAASPGLRVPGAFDGFELAVRAILGQQVSVKAATTLAGRFAEAFGQPIATPYGELRRLSPLPATVAAASLSDITSLGITGPRAASIKTLAEEISSGRLRLDPGTDHQVAADQLVSLPGIGPWTASYVAMRALRSPDAFPAGDLIIRKNLGGVTAARAEEMSLAWSPWRSYATLHLWRGRPILNR
ncbi:MAG: DNA-3-methyladenine glycosylase 2 family protein [Gemmatimonadaceae bacterium]